MYCNDLTGLCRPEELLRLLRYATQLGRADRRADRVGDDQRRAGLHLGHRLGDGAGGREVLSPSAPQLFRPHGRHDGAMGEQAVLVDRPRRPEQGAVLDPLPRLRPGHIYRHDVRRPLHRRISARSWRQPATPTTSPTCAGTATATTRSPDPTICDFVQGVERRRTSGRSRDHRSTSEAFRAFEQRYGDKLPRVRGDCTPYWEDGAGSSAAETAMNRASSERLAQAETLWAMLQPGPYPGDSVRGSLAQRAALLRTHLGRILQRLASRPIRSPPTSGRSSSPMPRAANLQSRQLLSAAAQTGLGFPARSRCNRGRSAYLSQFDVFNTTFLAAHRGWCSCPRTVRRPATRVTDDARPACASAAACQRRAGRVGPRRAAVRRPPLHDRPRRARRWRSRAKASATGRRTRQRHELRVRMDEQTGGIVELRAVASTPILPTPPPAMRSTITSISSATTCRAPAQRAGQDHRARNGPLVASLLVESDAPGCHKLSREVRLVAGGDYVELIDTVDKKRLEAESYYAKDGKESVNFAFPFNVPGGEMRLDVPLGRDAARVRTRCPAPARTG